MAASRDNFLNHQSGPHLAGSSKVLTPSDV
jgi:hypothetical protein